MEGITVYSEALSGLNQYVAFAFDPDMDMVIIGKEDSTELALALPLFAVASKPNKFDEEGRSTQKENMLRSLFSRLPLPTEAEMERVVTVPSLEQWARQTIMADFKSFIEKYGE